MAWVSSPLVYWGLSTSRVLTLEYLPGIKISDVTALRAAGIDTTAWSPGEPQRRI